VATLSCAAFHTIDDWAGVAYPPSARSTPMTNAQVDQAMSMLFGAVAQSSAIIEFAHHDYMALLNQKRFPLFTTSRKVIVLADIETCIARNAARRSPVSANYVERAWLSARQLIDSYAVQSSGHALVVDTTATSISTAVAMVARFFNQE
jgi:hypothetical protein